MQHQTSSISELKIRKFVYMFLYVYEMLHRNYICVRLLAHLSSKLNWASFSNLPLSYVCQLFLQNHLANCNQTCPFLNYGIILVKFYSYRHLKAAAKLSIYTLLSLCNIVIGGWKIWFPLGGSTHIFGMRVHMEQFEFLIEMYPGK